VATLDPAAEVIVQALSDVYPRLGTDVLDAAEARRLFEAMPRPAVEPIPVGRVEERAIPGPDQQIPIRIYWPETGGGPSPPVVVFFHGGGWVLASLDTHDQLCRMMTADAGVITVSVDYRLAPAHRFPAAAEDAFAATRWAADHVDELGGDPARLAVAGDSAGGTWPPPRRSWPGTGAAPPSPSSCSCTRWSTTGRTRRRAGRTPRASS
jgi:acetyl esterase/lipase